MKNLTIAILCGGPSTEHEVSVNSTRNIYNAIDKEKYEIHLIGIDKKGKWSLIEPSELNNNEIILGPNHKEITVLPGNKKKQLVEIDGKSIFIDLVFPVLHGNFGEDGTLQGLLQSANIPFVGCDLISSAVCMDKAITKDILTSHDINVSPGMIIFEDEADDYSFENIKARYDIPFFIKPANSGSSVGVSKITNEKEYVKGLKEAFKHDKKILIEKAIGGLEIEVSVMGNNNPIASTAGAIIPKDFYSYEEKYEADVAQCLIPAPINEEQQEKIKDIAIKAYKLLGCTGLSRVDFFLQDDEIYLNEVNTLPGFTNISMFPKLFEYDGISQAELIDMLISYALENE